jgi:alpha-tubulin suppressor-like RCC1 family protein
MTWDHEGIDCHVPQLLTTLLGVRVRAIAAGWDTPCAVTNAGALFTWGRNPFGNLGHGDVLDRDPPTLVQALQGIRAVGVSICETHTLALAADGSVYSFGEGLGLGISRAGEGWGEAFGWMPTPRRIPNLSCMVPP